ncbi:hypothetical protein HK097_006475 [Rhizophlyctis rosea]|uniref:Uncharacterized protein n=1 Tax=Rhizophlyctis rosea TaxID=64517 RepID=A0AAD5SCN4_9FUNG|nr:hypothetical protein HK097_006475 [Rhizophlyctis rosea]
MIASVVDKIMSSPEYAALVASIIEDARNNVESAARLQEEQQRSSNARAYLRDQRSSALEEIKAITLNLNARNPVDVRLTAVQSLASFSSADLLCGEFWPDAKAGLETALADGDSRIILASLRIYARAFRASPPHLTGDVYLSLVTHLNNLFDGQYSAKVADGLDTADWRTDVMLRKFRLLNQFQCEITSCWYRFPEQMFRDVMDQTFRLLQTARRSSSVANATASVGSNVTALHYLGLVDPRALWFEKWMLSKFGRTQVVTSMTKADLVPDLATSFLTHAAALAMLSASMGKASDEVVVMDVDANEDSDLSRTIIAADLDYVHFLHALIMLGKLSLYSPGRQCFPVEISDPFNSLRHAVSVSLVPNVSGDSKEKTFSISIDDLTDIFLRLMCQCSKAALSNNSPGMPTKLSDLATVKLSRVTCKLLKDIISIDTQCSRRLFKDAVLLQLMHPIKLALEGKLVDAADDSLLLDVAETLSDIATTEMGKQFILRGEAGLTDTKSSSQPHASPATATAGVIEVIVSFVRSSLSGTMKRSTSVKVLGAYIFVLRQLYRTCEGLLRLQRYDLHKLLSATVENATWMKSVKDQASLLQEWTTISVDNLLNFAGTPKGVLLLQQSGSMEPCVSYMFHRYERKMQVSKCEKFGYGVLVSQISSTKPGMQALYNTGLIRFFVNTLWTALERDCPFGVPDVELDDYGIRKAMSNLLKVFSSFHGLAIVLALEGQKGGRRDELSFLLKRLISADVSHAAEPLVYQEESHQIGLKILSLIMSSLDSFLLMEATFQFKDLLTKLQRQVRIRRGRTPDLDVFVVDENSLLRNYILVTLSVTGGPGERTLPPVQLQNGQVTERCHLFAEGPVPAYYAPLLAEEQALPLAYEELRKLTESKNGTDASGWLKRFRKAMLHAITGAPSSNAMATGQFKDCVTAVLKVLTKVPKPEAESMGWLSLQATSTNDDKEQKQRNKTEELGISLVVDYIARFSPARSKEDTRQKLGETLTKCHALLQTQRRPQPSESVANFEGFDWFLSTIFILLDADSSATLEFLRAFFKSMPSIHLVEAIVETELPEVFSAFTLSGCTPSQICQRWIREVFWNVLPFREIANYVLLALAFGMDYMVYFCIALLRHASPRMMLATREQELILFLNEARYGLGEGFATRDHVSFMQSLEVKYRVMVMTEMKTAVGLE